MAATTNTQLNRGGGYSESRSRGNRTVKRVLFDMNITSYSTGGETLPTAAQCGFKEILAVFACHIGTTTAYLFNWDSTAKKLVCLVATGTEATSTVAVGHVYLEIVGR